MSRELPILCKDSVALNIREGRQTQHRVPVKFPCGSKAKWRVEHQGNNVVCLFDDNDAEKDIAAPWSVGDLLYVRECWKLYDWTEDGEPCVQYRSDMSFNWPHVEDDEAIEWLQGQWEGLSVESNYSKHNRACDQNWRPSIFMRKFASRTRLKVTRVWVERVQDISEEDAKAEGVELVCDTCGNHPDIEAHWVCQADYDPLIQYRVGFLRLWNSIYGEPKKGKPDYSWKANPWVWCCEFERAER